MIVYMQICYHPPTPSAKVEISERNKIFIGAETEAEKREQKANNFRAHSGQSLCFGEGAPKKHCFCCLFTLKSHRAGGKMKYYAFLPRGGESALLLS